MFVIAIPIVFWVLLGPGLALYINLTSASHIAELSRRSDGNIQVKKIDGDYFSGIKFRKVVVYSKKNVDYLPLLSADIVRFRISLFSLLSGDFIPSSASVEGFNSALHIESDGNAVLPEWDLKASNDAISPLKAGFALSSGSKRMRIKFEDGVLEIYKKYPGSNKPNKIILTHLEGKGLYRDGEGVRIDEMSAKYYESDITISGFIAAENKDSSDLTLNFTPIGFKKLFDDLSPLFGNSNYLPIGSASGNIVFNGSMDFPKVSGTLNFGDSRFHNVEILKAKAEMSYSAGVFDLTGITAATYDGTLKAVGSVNLLSDKPTWEVSGEITHIDLGAYLTSAGYESSYEIDGYFDGNFTAKGDFVKSENLTCDVTLTSDTGTYLSPLSEKFLRGLSGTKPTDSILDPDDLAIYDQLDITAQISENFINITKFKLLSYDLQVDCTGKIGFDHSVNVKGNLSVPTEKAKRHPEFGKFSRLLPDSMKRVNLGFSLTGNLEKIKFNPMITDNLLQGLLDGGSDLLHKMGGN